MYKSIIEQTEYFELLLIYYAFLKCVSSHENISIHNKSSEFESTVTKVYGNGINYNLPIATAVPFSFASSFQQRFQRFLRKHISKLFKAKDVLEETFYQGKQTHDSCSQ